MKEFLILLPEANLAGHSCRKGCCHPLPRDKRAGGKCSKRPPWTNVPAVRVPPPPPWANVPAVRVPSPPSGKRSVVRVPHVSPQRAPTDTPERANLLEGLHPIERIFSVPPEGGSRGEIPQHAVWSADSPACGSWGGLRIIVIIFGCPLEVGPHLLVLMSSVHV